MPESPELDQVARKIAEAKELAREVDQPVDEVDEATGAGTGVQPVHEESEEGFTPS